MGAAGARRVRAKAARVADRAARAPASERVSSEAAVALAARGPSDAQLIARARFEPAAFAAIFDRHNAAIHGYLRRRLDAPIAEELAAETFARALRGSSVTTTTVPMPCRGSMGSRRTSRAGTGAPRYGGCGPTRARGSTRCTTSTPTYPRASTRPRPALDSRPRSR